MNQDLKSRFLATARDLRDKMMALCETDPVGEFEVCAGACRSNRDRLASIESWVERLEGQVG